jgi:DNA polymerase-3 subunit epsilon
MLKTLLIVDTETTGLSHETDRVIEVAAALYDLEHATPIEFFSSLCRADANPAESVNRIPVGALGRARASNYTWSRVSDLVGCALRLGLDSAVFVAHRAEFDRGFFPAALADRMPWVCSKYDIEWPRSDHGEGLVHVALAHDVPVVAAHRALADVLTLVRLFQRVAEMGHDVQAMLARAMRPKARFVVAERAFDAARNAIVKAHRFAWDANRREWWRQMAIEDAAALPFETRRSA